MSSHSAAPPKPSSAAVATVAKEAAATAPAPAGQAPAPLIPLSVLDAPTQRVYLASAFLGIQAYKLYRLLVSIFDEQGHTEVGTLVFVDFAFVVIASRLHIPRFDFTRRRWSTLFAFLVFLNWTATGGWRWLARVAGSIPVFGFLSDLLINSWSGVCA